MTTSLSRQLIHRTAELRGGDRLLAVRDEAAVRQQLRGFLADAVAMTQLRQLLREESFGDVRPLSDHAVIDALSQRIASGRLRIIEREGRRLPAITHSVRTVAAEPRPEPAPRRPEPAPAPPPAAREPGPVLDDPGLVAQAATLRQASENGTPFCEECERARAAQAQESVF